MPTNGATKTYETYFRQGSEKGVKVTRVKKKPTKLDWAYLAGFYDGEGTVTATRQVRKSSLYFQLRFVISNTEFELLCGLMEMFGGSIHRSSVKKPAHWKQVYMWHIESKENCLHVLRGMLPYIKYKIGEVRLAIEFFAGMRTPLKSGQPLANVEVARRNRIVEKIRNLPGRRTLRGRVEGLASETRDFKRNCKLCGKLFERETTTAVYCSFDCRVIARQNQMNAHNEKRRKTA